MAQRFQETLDHETAIELCSEGEMTIDQYFSLCKENGWPTSDEECRAQGLMS